MAYLMYRTLRKSGIRWALWRPDSLRVAEASTAQASVDTTDASEGVDAETSDTERPGRAAWKLPAVPTPRALPDLTRALAVLPLVAAAVLAVGVAPFVMIPLAVLLAAVMLLRSRRLR